MVEFDQIVPLIKKSLYESEDLPRISFAPYVQEFQITLIVDQPQDLAHGLLTDLPSSESDHLVEKRERIPHAPVGLPGDGSQSIFRSREAFLLENHP